MASIEFWKQLDPAQLFRLFVDGRFHKASKYNGWIGYEAREPGSVQAMLNGFCYMLDNLHAPHGVTAQYLCNLHRICMINVHSNNPKSSPGEIRYQNSGMPFFKKTTTYENIVEFVKYRRNDDSALFFDHELANKPARLLNPDKVFELLQTKGKLTYRAWMPELSDAAKRALDGKTSLHAFYQTRHAIQLQLIDKMEQLLVQYHRQINLAQNDHEKLIAIAWLVRELEILHPFPDGNCRVFACVLLNQLLLSHDFPPACLLNPNLDFENSFDQWLEEIKRGIENTRLLLDNPSAELFGYSIDEMPEQQRLQFLAMAQALTDKITGYSELFLTPERLQHYTEGTWITPAPSGLRYNAISTHGNCLNDTLYFAASIPEWKKAQKNIWSELQKCVDKNIRTLVLDDPEHAYGWDIPVLLVDDAMEALVDAATENRKEADPLTLLVTGTEGKTGTKIQLHHVLKQQVPVHARLDSGNTLIPIFGSLASLEKNDRVEINEVSVDADTEKTALRSRIINPDICFFSNISAEHMHVHKTLQGVMEHKAAVVDGLKADGKCILNSTMTLYHDFAAVLRERKPAVDILTFGNGPDDAARLLEQRFDMERLGWHIQATIGQENVEYFLPLFHHHAPMMSVGVLLAVKTLGFDVKKAAQDFAGIRTFESMGQIYSIAKDQGRFLLLDQSRRASISGVRSLFKDLENLNVPGKIVALFGSVSSVKTNEWSDAYHTELAELIGSSKIKRLYTTGPNMEVVYERLEDKSIFVTHSEDFDALYKAIMLDIQAGDLLVIQGYLRLNLADIALRVINYHPDEKLADESPLLELADDADTRYRCLLFLKDLDQGTNSETAGKAHGLTPSDIDALRESAVDYRKYRGLLLAKFFTGLDQMLPAQWGLLCINDAIKRSGLSKWVHNAEFCEQWFNNGDKIPELPKKQLFGSFYDFGDPRYIFHIMAGSTNFHIGLVKYRKQNYKYETEKMDSNDFSQIQQRFGEHLPGNLQLVERKWGFGWITIDCGTFNDPCKPEVFSAFYDTANSPFYSELLKPLLTLLKPGKQS